MFCQTSVRFSYLPIEDVRMNFYTRLDELFEDIEEQTGLSRHRLLIEMGLDPTQYRAYRKAGRLLSDPMLISIAKSSLCTYTLNTLMAWKALSEYGEEVIEVAAKLIKQDRKTALRK